MMSCFTYFEDTSAAGGGLPQPALIPVGRVAPDPDELLASAPGLTALPLAPAPLLPALVDPLVLLAPAVLVDPLVLLAPVLGDPLVPAAAVAPEVDPLVGDEPEDDPLASAVPPELIVFGDVLLEQATATNMAAQAARGRRLRERA